MPQSKATIVFEWIGKYVVPFATAALVGLMVFALNTLSRIDTSLGTLNEATATLKTDIREARSDIKDVRKDVADLRDRVGKLEAAVDLHGKQLFRLERARTISFESTATAKDFAKDQDKRTVSFDKSLPFSVDPKHARVSVMLKMPAMEGVPGGWHVSASVIDGKRFRVVITFGSDDAAAMLRGIMVKMQASIPMDVWLTVPE